MSSWAPLCTVPPDLSPGLRLGSRPWLTSAILTHTFAGSVPPRLLRRLGQQISPGKNMIFPRKTPVFSITHRSVRAWSSGDNSPWGLAILCSFCPSACRVARGLFSDGRSPFYPYRRLVVFKLSVMTTLQAMYGECTP